MLQNQRLRKIKKDYQAKNLKNPFFRQRKKGRGRRLLKWLPILGLALLIFLIWFFFASACWRIQTIKITGLTRLAGSEIENRIWTQTASQRWVFFQENNIFLFQETLAVQKILDAYNFSHLEISKQIPHTLTVKISERPYAFIFQQGIDFYFASSDGYLIKEATVTDEDKKKYLILENKNSLDLISEKNRLKLTDDYRQFVLDLAQGLSAYPDLSPERFIIDQEFNTVKVKFLSGPLVYFNTKSSAAEQVNRLVLVKKEKIKDNFSKTNYIDLRYGEKIFIN